MVERKLDKVKVAHSIVAIAFVVFLILSFVVRIGIISYIAIGLFIAMCAIGIIGGIANVVRRKRARDGK